MNEKDLPPVSYGQHVALMVGLKQCRILSFEGQVSYSAPQASAQVAPSPQDLTPSEGL
jgi:hypothetical protein